MLINDTVNTMDSLERVKQTLREHLRQFELDQASINTIVDEDLNFLTTWELPPSSYEELQDAQAVISFSFGFGHPKKGIEHPPNQYHPLLHEPGRSNEALAKIIKPFALRGMTIFTQWEIAEALKALGIKLPDSQVARSTGNYLGTSDVVEYFLANGLDTFCSVVLVAHPHHVFRCREITQTIYRKNGCSIHTLIADTKNVPYDPDSFQSWTRNVNNWIEYEVGNRFHNRYSGNM